MTMQETIITAFAVGLIISVFSYAQENMPVDVATWLDPAMAGCEWERVGAYRFKTCNGVVVKVIK